MDTKTIEQMTNAEILSEYFETNYDTFIFCKIIETHTNILEIKIKLEGFVFADSYVNIKRVDLEQNTIYGEIDIELVKGYIAGMRINNN